MQKSCIFLFTIPYRGVQPGPRRFFWASPDLGAQLVTRVRKATSLSGEPVHQSAPATFRWSMRINYVIAAWRRATCSRHRMKDRETHGLAQVARIYSITAPQSSRSIWVFTSHTGSPSLLWQALITEQTRCQVAMKQSLISTLLYLP